MSSQKIESDNEQIKNKKEETNNKNPSQQQQQPLFQILQMKLPAELMRIKK